MRWRRAGGIAAMLALSLAAGSLQAVASKPLPPRPPLGNPHARVKVYIFEDLQCPDCAQWHKYLRAVILPRYGKRVAFYLRDFPLPQHTWSFNAAVLERYFAARNAALYFAWVDYCYQYQAQITSANLMRRASEVAARYGLHTSLDRVFTKTRYFQAVEKDQALGNRIGIDHTPTIYLGRPGGEQVNTYAQLQHALERQLMARR